MGKDESGAELNPDNTVIAQGTPANFERVGDLLQGDNDQTVPKIDYHGNLIRESIQIVRPLNASEFSDVMSIRSSIRSSHNGSEKLSEKVSNKN